MSQSTVVNPAFGDTGEPPGATHPVDRPEAAQLEELVEHAAHLLPAQGPLSVFVHHNTLHAFEELSFEQAVVKASSIFGCEPFMPEEWYRQEYARGRILDRDLQAVVEEHCAAGHSVAGAVGRRQFLLALLRHPLHSLEGEALRWHLNETGSLSRFRKDIDRSVRHQLQIETLSWLRAQVCEGVGLEAVVGTVPEEWTATNPARLLTKLPEDVAVRGLWTACRNAVERVPLPGPRPPQTIRHRDVLVEAGARDPDSLVHPLLIRFCAAYLDQGQALEHLPGRERGLYACFRELYSLSGVNPGWMEGLVDELRRELGERRSSVDCALHSLRVLGVEPAEREVYIRDTLLALKGWAGMVYQAQVRPDRLPGQVVPARLLDFLAVRLLLDRYAAVYCARELVGREVAPARMRTLLRPQPTRPTSLEARAYRLFQLVQFLGLPPAVIHSWTADQIHGLLQALEDAGDLERRQLFHLAYERRLRVVTLDALALHPPHRRAVSTPEFQAIFCIDERECSTRRHLEEFAPDCETFGAAGFFGVAMYFKAVHEAHPVALCPVVVRPSHLVVEIPDPHRFQEAERLAAIRRSLGRVAHQVQIGSQTLTLGSVVTSGLGIISSLPLLFRILFPRTAGRMGRNFRKQLLPSETRLEILRDPENDRNEDGLWLGYSFEEMTRIVGTLLEDIGLTRNFSDIVLVVGHGSSSLNNPHESAHDCGACGGGRGGPNARVFAWMANHPTVRRALAERGLKIPDSTRFVGGYHNTCDDDLDLFDLDEVPEALLPKLERAAQALHEARARDAQERCRRFEMASAEVSPRSALIHVEARAEDLAQVRPEYGHATNAICIVGRRARTRGLFLDRRAFLMSYDPDQDDEQGTILGRILRAVVPVGAGINLEYYFSFVDNTGYGCGTKLPHNITGLIGVMDGHASDLRTGLPWQMVEIHEPVRLLSVIEARRSVVEAVVAREPGVRILVQNRWVQVALLDPDSQAITTLGPEGWSEYRPEAGRLPVVGSSLDWFHHHREHLHFAEIIEGEHRRTNGVTRVAH